jgi:chemotaxis protein MotB
MVRKQPEQPPELERMSVGMVMSTSLNILILAFFIMLTGISVRDERRERQGMGSLVGNFGIQPRGLSAMESKAQHIAPPSSPLDTIKSDTEQMKKVLAQDIVEDKVRVLKGRTRRILRFQETSFFSPNGVEVEDEAKPMLKELADIMNRSTYQIAIEGHTDDQPPQNEVLIDNWYVSATRAANLLRFFIREGGIDPRRLSAYGYAGYSPLVVNNSPENRARNRRVEMVLDTREPSGAEDYENRSLRPGKFLFKGFSFDLFGPRERP